MLFLFEMCQLLSFARMTCDLANSTRTICAVLLVASLVNCRLLHGYRAPTHRSINAQRVRFLGITLLVEVNLRAAVYDCLRWYRSLLPVAINKTKGSSLLKILSLKI